MGVWTKGDASAFKNTVNKMRAKSPDGKVHVLLVSGTDDKVKSNITTMEAGLNLMDRLVGEGILTQNQIDKLIVDSLNDIIDALPAKKEGRYGEKVKFKEREQTFVRLWRQVFAELTTHPLN